VTRAKANPAWASRPAETVADYLARVPRDARAALQKLRKDIKAAAPKAVELIAWGMPAFKQERQLVGYAAFKDHCSFFPMSAEVIRRHASDLREYDTTKGSIHFTPEKPLPAALVRRIVKARLAENEARRASHRR